MPEIAPQAVMLDGPLAGHITTVPDGLVTVCLPVPSPFVLSLSGGTAQPPRGELAYYSLSTQRYSLIDGDGARLIVVRVGSVKLGQPGDELLHEMIPTALAEMGILRWSEVPYTRADLDRPVPVELLGDPGRACDVAVSNPFVIPQNTVYATCDCGWSTGYGIPLARRSQVVRAANKHIDEEEARRARYRLPIRVTAEGTGATDICYAAIRATPIDTIYGHCDECGWRTEDVEPFRRGPLWDLCKPHMGPHGVRHVRNRMLRGLGLPTPTDEEEATNG